MTPTILIYNDRDSKTCSAELSMALNKSFHHDHVAIVETDRHHLARNIKELRPSVIVLPEIKGIESFYNRHINRETRALMLNHVAQGAKLVTICAAAYWTGSNLTFHPPQGETKFRSGDDMLNAFNIKSYGPPSKEYWRCPNGQEDLGGCHVVPLRVKTKDGWVHDHVWYGNGPAFYPQNNRLPENIEVLARYRRVAGQPIAAYSAPYGKGSIDVSGVLSHYHTPPVQSNNFLWRVMSHRMHEQLFAKQQPAMVSVPS